MTITFRNRKGAPLTSAEIDANFEVVESLQNGNGLTFESLLAAMAVSPIPVDYTPFTIRNLVTPADNGYYIYLAAETNGYKKVGDFVKTVFDQTNDRDASSMKASYDKMVALDAVIQTELNTTQAGSGLNPDGTYTPDATTNYLALATSLKEADKKLDTAIKNVNNNTGINEDAIAQESNDRFAADATLQSNINAEANTRDDTDVVLQSDINKNIAILINGDEAYAHASRTFDDGGTTIDLQSIRDFIKLNRRAKLGMIPNTRRPSKLFSILPTDGTGDFTFVGSAVDEISSAGVSTTVIANTPRFDYQGTYITPTDNSYYNADVSTGKVTFPTQTFATGKPWTAIINGNFVKDPVNGYGYLIGGNSVGVLLIAYTDKISYRSSLSPFAQNTFPTAPYSLVAGLDKEMAFTCDGVEIRLYIDGVYISSVTPASTGLSMYRIIKGDSSDAFGCSGNVYKFEIYNRNLSATEVLVRFNKVALDEKYLEANNVSKTAGSFTIGKNYRIDTIGTTDFTLIGASANTVGLEFVATGIGAGTGSATTAGNTLLFEGGKTSSIWYDKTHAITGTVVGSTLGNSNNFTSEVHPLTTCPQLLLEGGTATNLFLNSGTPVTQTVTTVIGTTYTISCVGAGLLTVSETGGNGVGGVVTEADPFTYIATATSMVVTVVTRPDNVNFTNTNIPINHIPTAGASASKVSDALSLTGLQTNGLLGATEGTLFIDFGTFKHNHPGQECLLLSKLGTYNDSLGIWLSSNDLIYIRVTKLSVITTIIGNIIISNKKLIVSYNATSVKVYLAGVEVANFATTDAQAYDQLKNYSSKYSSRINKIWLRNTMIDATEAIQLTL